MTRLLAALLVFACLLVPAAVHAADAAPPLVDLPFAGNFRNAGSLGGEATLAAPVPAEAAVDLEPEVHPDATRITLPRLATWGILTVSPSAAP